MAAAQAGNDIYRGGTDRAVPRRRKATSDDLDSPRGTSAQSARSVPAAAAAPAASTPSWMGGGERETGGNESSRRQPRERQAAPWALVGEAASMADSSPKGRRRLAPDADGSAPFAHHH